MTSNDLNRFDRESLDNIITEAENMYWRLYYDLEKAKATLDLLYSARQRHDQLRKEVLKELA